MHQYDLVLFIYLISNLFFSFSLKVPTNLPIEGYDLGLYFENSTLPSYLGYQQLIEDEDRHAIVVRLGDTSIFEWWQMRLMLNGTWTASNEATFNFSSNAQRPLGWTSADACIENFIYYYFFFFLFFF